MELPTKANLGMDGETRNEMVSNLAKNVQSAEDHPHGAAAGGNCGY